MVICVTNVGVYLQELNREEPAGLGGPNSERHILDSRGALVERRAVVCRERLIIGHCLVLSLLVVRASKFLNNAFCSFSNIVKLVELLILLFCCILPKRTYCNCLSGLMSGPKDVKDIFATLKDSAGDIGGSTDIVKNQVCFWL